MRHGRCRTSRLARRAAARHGANRDVAGPYDRFPGDLSGGEQQRVAIARAVAGSRQVILADEPTGALDTVTGEMVIDLLADLAAEGTAVVLVTHEPRYATRADRVVFMRDGQIVDETDPLLPPTPPSGTELARAGQ